MVNAVVPTDQLDPVTQEIIDAIAAGPPLALALASSTRALDNAARTSLAQALETEALAQSVNAQTDDVKEALMAYAERRPTNFTGR
jgi:2-(1,2-epoxy-1,2-dihydrophenyl)acetyl-CoA isomerase